MKNKTQGTTMTPKTEPTTSPKDTSFSSLVKSGVLPETFWVTIPHPDNFDAEEREIYEAGEYPLTVDEYLPEHLPLLDFLADQGVREWRRRLTVANADVSATKAETSKGGK